MKQLIVIAILGACQIVRTASAQAQDPDLRTALGFEAATSTAPAGWTGGPAETIAFDSVVVHAGRGAARLHRTPGSQNDFTALTKSIPVDFSGRWIVFRGFLKAEEVDDFAGFWMRQDGVERSLQFVSMETENRLSGTTDWEGYAVQLPLDPRADRLFFGVVLRGTGTVWADDLDIIVDGFPIEQAPRRQEEGPTVLDIDRQFNEGSALELSDIDEVQIAHLVILGRVWGFLKYHHPRVAAGEFHWDYELFRVLPEVLGASGQEPVGDILARWIREQVGVPGDCSPCAEPPSNPSGDIRVGWIWDEDLLGPELSSLLQHVYANRFVGDKQFYVSSAPRVGNPVFDHELLYEDLKDIDGGYRVLALLRLWNIIEYWYPYVDLQGNAWERVLREFLPRFIRAQSADDYQLELLRLIASIGDAHANLSSANRLLPPRGDCFLPGAVRFVEGQPVVVATPVLTRAEPGLEIGDVILSLDGFSVDALIESWAPYYSASNYPGLLFKISNLLGRGPCGKAPLVVHRGGEVRDITVERVPEVTQPPPHDRPGESFQLLGGDVAYLNLSNVQFHQLDGYIERAAGTKGLVLDLRNYPPEFVVFSLSGHFVRQPTPFVRFTLPNPDNPGVFSWTSNPLSVQPVAPIYEGTVVILVDESTISRAEYTAMALRVAPMAVVVGSTTAGADGDVSRIGLPGGLETGISGIGVFYPDKSPTQRIGIVPDILVTPTIAGIRAGHDEMLEVGLRVILGDDTDSEVIHQLASPR